MALQCMVPILMIEEMLQYLALFLRCKGKAAMAAADEEWVADQASIFDMQNDVSFCACVRE
eukprot:901320-Rhodomonas_salina.2